MENANDKPLSFPQRNWFLLCVLVAILSPLVVNLVRGGARREKYRQSTEIRAADTATGAGTAAGGNGVAIPGGATGADTSYKVASPPGAADTANKKKQ
jgi:hypothetical protein